MTAEEIRIKHEQLKAQVRRASYNVNRTNNLATRKAYDDAITEITAFEKKHITT